MLYFEQHLVLPHLALALLFDAFGCTGCGWHAHCPEDRKCLSRSKQQAEATHSDCWLRGAHLNLIRTVLTRRAQSMCHARAVSLVRVMK